MITGVRARWNRLDQDAKRMTFVVTAWLGLFHLGALVGIAFGVAEPAVAMLGLDIVIAFFALTTWAAGRLFPEKPKGR